MLLLLCYALVVAGRTREQLAPRCFHIRLEARLVDNGWLKLSPRIALVHRHLVLHTQH